MRYNLFFNLKLTNSLRYFPETLVSCDVAMLKRARVFPAHISFPYDFKFSYVFILLITRFLLYLLAKLGCWHGPGILKWQSGLNSIRIWRAKGVWGFSKHRLVLGDCITYFCGDFSYCNVIPTYLLCVDTSHYFMNSSDK